MDKHAADLRRRIALYRSYLREGVSAELARRYLDGLAHDEAELSVLEGRRNEATGSTTGGRVAPATGRRVKRSERGRSL